MADISRDLAADRIKLTIDRTKKLKSKCECRRDGKACLIITVSSCYKTSTSSLSSLKVTSCKLSLREPVVQQLRIHQDREEHLSLGKDSETLATASHPGHSFAADALASALEIGQGPHQPTCCRNCLNLVYPTCNFRASQSCMPLLRSFYQLAGGQS